MLHPVLTFADFFAGSGLVTEGLKGSFRPVWANDIDPQKASIYTSNQGSAHFHLGPIEEITGTSLPPISLAWASFPCQDLSLAGKMEGLQAARSGLFWEWLRVIDQLTTLPPVLVLENVVGLLSSRSGADFKMLIQSLGNRGYRVGSMVLDAKHWLPQSRKRVFIVAVQRHLDTRKFEDNGPNWTHPQTLRTALASIDDITYWYLPKPRHRVESLASMIQWDAPVFDQDTTAKLLSLVSDSHRKLLESLGSASRAVIPGYRRTRKGKQVLELRFDGLAGCLRTARGGSSRQFVLLQRNGHWDARLLTSREAAALMGAPRTYRLAQSYNESYNAMGDAVAVPIVRYLTDHLFRPILQVQANDKARITATPICGIS